MITSLPMLSLLKFHSNPLCSSPAEQHPKPIYFCPFNNGLCGWTHDPNSWHHRWSVDQELQSNGPANSMCCFSVKHGQPLSESSTTDADSPWLIPNLPVQTVVSGPSNKEAPIQARLWSPAFPVALKLQCFQFSYRLELNHPSEMYTSQLHGETQKQVSLSLLQRREGWIINYRCLIVFASLLFRSYLYS